MKTIVAFANTQGGKLVVGVDDKTHEIVGVENEILFQLMDGIANAVSDSCMPQIIPDIEPQTVDEKTVIIVSVEAGKNRPYYLKSKGKENGTYIRVAGTSRQAFPEKIRELEMGRQLECNTAIAREGLRGDWGANIGSTLLLSGGDVETEARAWAAAGSDARMNGCEMPVVICSGSGNQGITASVPVWRYGVQTGRDRETILRAVCLSDLITIHQKTGIGRLSAYCGAVSAGVGAGCGIAWLRGADYEGICHTITNAAAMISGCICDGAKASCASKIAMGVETGILGYNMYLRGNSFRPGDGIVGRDVEETIRNVGILASQGMKETDRVILKIMTE